MQSLLEQTRNADKLDVRAPTRAVPQHSTSLCVVLQVRRQRCRSNNGGTHCACFRPHRRRKSSLLRCHSSFAIIHTILAVPCPHHAWRYCDKQQEFAHQNARIPSLQSTPVMEGWLSKKSPKGLASLHLHIHSWQKRYFILYPKNLVYYKNDKSRQPLGTVTPTFRSSRNISHHLLPSF